MLKLLLAKVKESVMSVLPVFLIVIVLMIAGLITGTFRFDKTENIWTFILFLVGSIMLVVGLSLFTLGADLSLLKVGEQVGNFLASKRKVWLLILVGFLIGVIITIAEPDLLHLANSFPSLEPFVLILAVGLGVGVFLAVALLRIVLQVSLVKLLIVLYSLTFLLAFIVNIKNPEFLPVAFDSGGVTTGPMTVPFILALGVGVSRARGGRKSDDDSFGLVALCSVGPIIAVLFLGLFANANVTEESSHVINTFWLALNELASVFVTKLGEIGMSLIGICTFIIIFEFAILRKKFKSFLKLFIGLLYVALGVAIFLTGAEIGFDKVGYIIGNVFGTSSYSWIIVPVGMVIGFFVVMAEPSVQVLNKQVEEITAGSISRKVMLFTLAIGVAISIGLSFLRVILKIDILWILVPGYLIAIILSLFSPKIFSAIAFDSGGVASGPMTATFLLPMASGLIGTAASTSQIVEFSFGTVAMVAMTPLIVIQILGLIYQIKTKVRTKTKERVPQEVITFKVDISKWVNDGN